MRKSGSVKKMYRANCSSLNWKVFRRARNKAVLAKDREVEEPSERFCLSMRLQGAPTSVLLDPRVGKVVPQKQMYRDHCSSLNWKVFRRARNKAVLAKDLPI